jgi:hypothetical protein
MMPSVQRVIRLVKVFGSDQQVGSANRRIHSTGIVGSDHGFNSNLVQNAFGDLSVGRRRECRNDSEV